jgi:hypothetical protein
MVCSHTHTRSLSVVARTLLIAVFVCSTTSCATRGPKPPDDLALVEYPGLLLQTATFANTKSGQTRTVKVIVDTGFDGTIRVSPDLVEQLGLHAPNDPWELQTFAGSTSVTLRGTFSQARRGRSPLSSGTLDAGTVKIGIDALIALGCSPAYNRSEGLHLLPNPEIKQIADLQEYTPLPLVTFPSNQLSASPVFANDQELNRWAVARGWTHPSVQMLRIATLGGVQGVVNYYHSNIPLPCVMAFANGERLMLVLDTATNGELWLFLPPESVGVPTTKVGLSVGPIPFTLFYAGQIDVVFEQGGFSYPLVNVLLAVHASDPEWTRISDGVIALPMMNHRDWILDLEQQIWFVRRWTPKPGSAPAP